MRYTLRAFTLVELIVVITIVWILSTVWFVSYSGYLTGARDSNRFSQLTKLSDSLQTYAASKSLPLPDDYIEITASGASNVFAYQWYVWVDVLETIDYTNGWRDPKDDTFYTYYLTKDRNSIQLLTLMEEQGSVASLSQPFLVNNESFAVDYEERFPKVYGKKLWVLTESVTNIPVQEVSAIQNGSWYLDIVQTTGSFTAYLWNDETISWTWPQLQAIIPNSSCKRIKQTWGAKWDGNYSINPAWIGSFDVYCDMENAGGGWMHIWSKTWSWFNSVGQLGTLPTIPWDSANVTIPDIGIIENLTLAMACSSENCWEWELNDTFRNCLVNSCNTQNSQNISVKKVSWNTWVMSFTATSFWYNWDAGSLSAMFEISNGSSGLWATTNRWNMNGTWMAAWAAWDSWDIYVK